jgi:DNA invertase Pin-like site-specific DNA recombinase
MSNVEIRNEHLCRTAYVYIRQSTPYQKEHNLESQRRQYQLVDKARALGFKDVQVIDEDLGLSGGVGTERSGFKKLVAEVSLNRVGIVFGLEVSRFARNNREWYHLLDLCALFDTLIADQEGIYHPGNPNDRMVLGLKGTMSEVELNLIKSRLHQGAENKAKRGELIYRLPVGLVKTDGDKIEKDPDLRIQKSIEQVFEKFRRCHSVRQTFLWFIQEQVPFPSITYGRYGAEVIWKRPVYRSIYDVLKNPFYAGAYVYGRRESRTHVEGTEIRKSKGHALEMRDWKTLIKDHHAGYISWEEYERNQGILKDNNARMAGMNLGAVLKGNGLLAGLLRCKRCGRKLSVSYGGRRKMVPRYLCSTGRIHRGEDDCIAFGGERVDKTVNKAVLEVVEPLAINASLKAIEELNRGIEEQRKLIELELENAEYEAGRAYRQYNKADPENRLVCRELEKKWNLCLESVEAIRGRLNALTAPLRPLSEEEKQELMQLSENLPKVWNAPSTTNEMRKRVIRTLVKEIVCDIDEEKHVVVLDIHWEGGVHTNLQVKKNRTGERNNCTDKSIVDLVAQLARQLPDKSIAPVLNKLKLKTGAGNTWKADRVKSLRSHNRIAAYSSNGEDAIITLEQAAERLGVCAWSVKKLISSKLIKAEQVVPYAPWAIPAQELNHDEVKIAIKRIREGQNRRDQYSRCEGQIGLFQ